MRTTRTVAAAVLAALALTAPSVALVDTAAAGPRSASAPTAKLAETLAAEWQMNEPTGSAVMVDSSGNGHHGAISPNAVSDGLTSEAGAYRWSLRCPACPPTAPGRVVQVPDSPELEIPDASVRYSIEFRFKTNKGYGNIMQKGQATNVGGQIKIENPNGRPRCVFIGANGSYVSVPSPIVVTDSVWHIVKCVHNAASVEAWLDGVQVAVKNIRTGPINNNAPFVVGGKRTCDQVKITCDYYTGYVDWIRITHGEGPPVDQPPTASFTASGCEDQTCSFDGSASSDPEHAQLTYDWDFGDGGTSVDAAPDHLYDDPGLYDVELTVTDPGGLSNTVIHQVTAGQPPAATVSFRAAASSNGNVSKPSVTVPAQVQAGDALVLVATTNRNATMTTPAGWTPLGTRQDGSDLKSWVFTRTAPAGSGGTKVTTTLDAISKTSLTLLAYADAGEVQVAASTAEGATSTSVHQSPSVPVAVDGSWVVSSWVDKTNANGGGWTLPAEVTARNANTGAGTGGIVTAASGDSGPLFAGTWPGSAATSSVASGKAIGWSVVVPPA